MCLKADGQGKIYFCEGCISNQSQASQHTEWEVCSFLSLMQVCPSLWWTGLGSQSSLIGYLEKEACWVRGTLKHGQQDNSFGQYSSLIEQFEIRTPSNKQLFDHKTLARSSNVSQSIQAEIWGG
jgi:hypothetical protein